jgi:SAM-dependent methyltransferase
MDDSQCRVCARRSLHDVERFGSLPRVTSDTRTFASGGRLAFCDRCGSVQKRADSQWRADIAGIYARYDMYAQGDGQEQRVFDATGASAHRSARLLERAMSELPQRACGSLLDVGCGTGVTLAAFAKLRAGWRLYGQDLDGRYVGRMRRIPGFAGLLREVPGWAGARFDIVTMIHSLEHFDDPVVGLADVRASLSEHGRVLVQVPDAKASPFDLVVADHLCHFEPRSLQYLMQRAGYVVESCEPWLPKEISLIARDGEATDAEPSPPGPRSVKARLEAQIAWLEGIQREAADIAAASPRFGIFGTAIAATWLFGALSGRAHFFVDEDAARVGRQHCERPIVSPDGVPDGARVYVPLLPTTARAVAARHDGRRAGYRVPPPLPAAAHADA